MCPLYGPSIVFACALLEHKRKGRQSVVAILPQSRQRPALKFMGWIRSSTSSVAPYLARSLSPRYPVLQVSTLASAMLAATLRNGAKASGFTRCTNTYSQRTFSSTSSAHISVAASFVQQGKKVIHSRKDCRAPQSTDTNCLHTRLWLSAGTTANMPRSSTTPSRRSPSSSSSPPPATLLLVATWKSPTAFWRTTKVCITPAVVF